MSSSTITTLNRTNWRRVHFFPTWLDKRHFAHDDIRNQRWVNFHTGVLFHFKALQKCFHCMNRWLWANIPTNSWWKDGPFSLNNIWDKLKMAIRREGKQKERSLATSAKTSPRSSMTDKWHRSSEMTITHMRLTEAHKTFSQNCIQLSLVSRTKVCLCSFFYPQPILKSVQTPPCWYPC